MEERRKDNMIRFLRLDSLRYRFSVEPDDSNFGIVSFGKDIESSSVEKDTEDCAWGRAYIAKMFFKYGSAEKFPERGMIAWY